MSVSLINGHIDKHDSDRNKMIELLMSKSCIGKECPTEYCSDCEYIAMIEMDADKIADLLITNGFGFKEKEGT